MKTPLEFDENQDPILLEDIQDDTGNESRRPMGPLSKIPSKKNLLPAAVLFILFYIFSFVLKHNFSDVMWISGDEVINKKEVWRLLTAIFIHADLQHLLSNAPLFLIFGWLLRDYYGILIFPAGSLIIGIAANLITVSLYDPAIRLIGASGMVYGMAAQWLVYYVRHDTNYSVGKRIFRASGFAMAMLFPTTVYHNVSYLAHAAGFFSGIAISLVMLPLIKMAPMKQMERNDTR